MVLMPARLLLLWFVTSCCTCVNSLSDGAAAEEEWEALSNTISKESSDGDYFYGRSAPIEGAYMLPDSKVVSKAEADLKMLFKPDNHTRPLPPSYKDMLLQAPVLSHIPPPPVRKLIEILCHVDRMYVRIRREIFKQDVLKDLRFGKCGVTVGNQEYYYFLYLLNQDCGIQKEYNVDAIIFHNKLVYNPTGVVIRDMPFEVALECRLPRYFHSFKRIFHPLISGRSYYKMLRAELSFKLTPRDELGVEKASYTLGQLMQFEAALPFLPSGSESQKIYINECFMTPSPDPKSNINYTIIDNYGCMIDSKESSQSTFLKSDSPNNQKFVMTAFLFNIGSAASSYTQQLYMHCKLALGSPTPSPVAKACAYDFNSNQWKELHGDQYNYVCACCETSCSFESTAVSDNSHTVSSHPWRVGMEGRKTR